MLSARLCLYAALGLFALYESAVDLATGTTHGNLSLLLAGATLAAFAFLETESLSDRAAAAAFASAPLILPRRIALSGIGRGDLKYLVLLGSALGFVAAFAALFLASLLFLAAALPLAARGRINARSRLPFVPFLSLGAALALGAKESLCAF
ncbi:MAG: hypothetical protein JNG85_07860 [Spirochaetaceae bacterium]|nr:hypothetical protein [Spirochaetaceae bacterium]